MSNETVDPVQAYRWLEKRFDKLKLTPSVEFLRTLGIPVHEGDESMPLSWHIRNQLEREVRMPARHMPSVVGDPRD